MKKSFFDPNSFGNSYLVFFLAFYYAFFNLINILKTYLLGLYNPAIRFPSFNDLLVFYIFDWVIVVFFMWGIAQWTKSLVVKEVSWISIAVIHILLSFLLGFLVRFIGDFINIVLGLLPVEEFSFARSTYQAIYVMDYNFLIYFSMLFMIYSFYYLKQSRLNEERKNILEEQLSQNKIKMLTGQLHPHFFFNTLNCISGLIHEDQDKAQSTLLNLSNFFREVLKEKEAQFISVEKELKILRYYTDILRVRFTEHLIIREKYSPRLLKQRIPALSIQPLVENAIKHGFSVNHPELEITISISQEKGKLKIIVENNGEKLDVYKDYHSGVGIANLRERITSMYGTEASFIIRNKRNAPGVENILTIPSVPLE